MNGGNILPLVNMTPAFPDLEELDYDDRPEIQEKADWLRKHPGRWALIGEQEDDMLRGFTERTAWRQGLRGNHRDTGTIHWHYACYPLAGMPTLEETIKATRWLQPFYPADLPALVIEPWPEDLMAEALATAREWRNIKRRRKRKLQAVPEIHTEDNEEYAADLAA